jgi:DNA-binding XRE family transcriptional regulator
MSAELRVGLFHQFRVVSPSSSSSQLDQIWLRSWATGWAINSGMMPTAIIGYNIFVMSPSAGAAKTGAYVRQARKTAGISQAELARRLESHQPAIARLEAGGAAVNMRTLERIAEALGLELKWEMVSRGEALRRGIPGQMRPKK